MIDAPKWNLETICPGGPTGEAFAQQVNSIESLLRELVPRADRLPDLPEALDDWSAILADMEDLSSMLQEARSFAGAWASAHSRNEEARIIEGRVRALSNQLNRAWVRPRDALCRCDTAAFEALSSRPELAELRPMLENMRRERHLLLPRAEQALYTELARDGLNAWSQLYFRTNGRIVVKLPDGREISAEQARQFLSNPDRNLRSAALEATQTAWNDVAPLCASALTHIVGARLTQLDLLGVDELESPLNTCRMERTTLEAMMEAAGKAQPILHAWMAEKAALLGLPGIGWQDVLAPVSEDTPRLTWAEACTFVENNLSDIHPPLSRYARSALDAQWVEATDRSDKRPGAWCAWFPRSAQSRVFMTFGGNLDSTLTLAHELGHGYHNFVMKDLPPSRRKLPMTLAETASTFSEAVVCDAALAAASTPGQQLAMYDLRLQSAVTMLMNIPARFQFERALYRLRRGGELTATQLSEEMVSCQQSAYGNGLVTWDPSFWAAKLHFYISEISFYNFPYTFGYLFSGLVKRRMLEEGPGFIPVVDDLLRRSGWERAEPLAMELLGLDLTDTATWQLAFTELESDLEGWKTAARQL